ncbi:hypothetical protein GCM10009764_03900 [Nocardia ninae]
MVISAEAADAPAEAALSFLSSSSLLLQPAMIRPVAASKAVYPAVRRAKWCISILSKVATENVADSVTPLAA